VVLSCKSFLAPPYVRQNVFRKARALVELVRGTLAARRLLKARETELVIGLGGYASVGAILAAKLLGIPSAIHEANVFPGLANRLIGSLADIVFLGWAQAGTCFQTKSVVTGNPVRQEMGRFGPRFEERCGDRHILVTGGSAGSPFLNENVPLLLAKVRDLGIPMKVRHQAGAGETEQVRGRYQGREIEARVEEFIDDMTAAYCESDYVITAAGALTLAELAMAGLPALLVPQSAAAEGHQIANAEVFSRLSGGAWVREEEWDAQRLAGSLAATLGDLDALSAQSNRLRKMATPNAAHTLVSECESFLNERRADRAETPSKTGTV
jgi:UDP-N-acetylglucosamine--N-acetylmuramyl-(pentapeptide) pyrophosphoryl-undecaprenol N-acetylglucosamine transferase